jgi:hypothetical protein
MMTTTMKMWFGAIGVGAFVSSLGCTQRAAMAPSDLATDATMQGTAASTYQSPVVTLKSDLTADPATVSVTAGQTVLVVNNSARYVRMRSSNCTEFLSMGLQPGVSRHTMPFDPAGKTCDYFVWDTNWSRKIFVGRIVVQ